MLNQCWLFHSRWDQQLFSQTSITLWAVAIQRRDLCPFPLPSLSLVTLVAHLQAASKFRGTARVSSQPDLLPLPIVKAWASGKLWQGFLRPAQWSVPCSSTEMSLCSGGFPWAQVSAKLHSVSQGALPLAPFRANLSVQLPVLLPPLPFSYVFLRLRGSRPAPIPCMLLIS